MTQALKSSFLEAQATAALGGHDLTAFEPVEDSMGRPNCYQAMCRVCGKTRWVGENGLRYSLLKNECPGR